MGFLSKLVIWLSFLIFLMLPIAITEFMLNGVYQNWYPIPWNIRVYNSYFLVLSIFAVWFYLKQEKFKNIYLFFYFWHFYLFFLDGGRSATLAYSVFIACVVYVCLTVRRGLNCAITMPCRHFLFVSHLRFSVRSIVRESTSGRHELWVSAFHAGHKIKSLDAGFYQLDQYSGVISAHPHNLFIQVLTETGLIGFGFLISVIWNILKE